MRSKINTRVVSLLRSDSYRMAFDLLNGDYGKIIPIVDSAGRYEGIVTEGDLRRGILRGDDVKGALEQCVNRNAIVIQEIDSGELAVTAETLKTIKARMTDKKALMGMWELPVLNDKGVLRGVVKLENVLLEETSPVSKGLAGVEGLVRPTVLVVGGTGYIGSVLTDELLALGFEVKVLDIDLYDQGCNTKFIQHERFTYIKADICDLHAQVDAVKDVEGVVFLAEIVGDPSCAYVPERALKTNFLAVSSMALLCGHLIINRFIYTSSCSVYGASEDPDVLLNENSYQNPVSLYARMKSQTEQYLLSSLNPLFAPTILRLATVFGHSFRPRFDLVVNTFAKGAFFDSEITVHGGSQWRPNVHVKDVCSAIINTLNAPIETVSRKVFNVGGNINNHTIMELAESAVEVFRGCRLKINEDVTDKRNYRVDFSKIENELGFRPEYSVEAGLMELRDYFSRNPDIDPNSHLYSNIEFLKKLEL